jgi:Ca2+:H+ antiporter
MIRASLKEVFSKPVNYLLPFTLLAIVLEMLHVPSEVILGAAALGIVPMAGLIGEGTEAVAAHAGPRVSGLLNATFGNAAELIIAIAAIREGLLELVKASITGSIIGNLLIVLGVSMLAGGIRNGVQVFDRQKATRDSILLVLAVTALAIPSLFAGTSGGIDDFWEVEFLSIGVAVLMMAVYILGLLYSFRSEGAETITRESAEEIVHKPRWSVRTGIIVLLISTVGVVIMSEILVGHVEPTIEALGISEFFLGVILVPLVGNVAEHLVAVSVAMKNRMTLSVEISISSSLQIALFVTPILVFLSLILGNPLTLVFVGFELIALIVAVWITAFVAEDGQSNWLEGAMLVALYIMLALAFFFL